MKRRKQLVSALITGVLLGGTAAASVTSVPRDTAAEEGKAAASGTDGAKDNSEEIKNREAEKEAAAAGTKAAAESADASDGTKEVQEEAGTADGTEAGAAGEQATDGAAAGPAGTDTGSAEGASGALDGANTDEAADTGVQEETAASQSESTDSAAGGVDPAAAGAPSAEEEAVSPDGTESTDSGASPAEAGDSAVQETESGDAGAENPEDTGTVKRVTAADGSEDTGAESAESTESAGEDTKTEGETAAAESGTSKAAATEISLETPIEYKTPEQISAEAMAEQIAVRKAAELERKRKEAERTRAARAEEAEKAKKEEDARSQAARRYSYAGASRAYYSGTYFVTNAQKRLALSVGFKRIEKRPAMAAGSEEVSIRESRSDGARAVGVLNAKDICYILSDVEAEPDWAYVESGEVRGFVRKSALKSGEEVSEYVELTGENAVTTAEQLVDPLENTAYRYSLNTTKDVASIIQALGTAAVNRQAMLSFGLQFLGNPYVWGGESLTTGCDCSGFTQQVYAQFGISLPRTSYEQAEVGVKIPAEEALPGDLLFYARDGVVYHVLMYMGDGKAVNASSSATGIIVSDVDYDKVCWGCRYISDSGAASSAVIPEISSTQASSLQAIGQMAYNGDAAAQEAIIEALAQASLKEWKSYGFCRSVIIAQAIEESGWLSFGTSAAGIQATDNNILGMNEDLNNSTWASPWGGKAATRLVPQYAGDGNVYDFESMRLYDDMEGCMEDYAAFKVGLHPDLIGETDVDHVIAVGLKGYATNPNYQSNIRSLIDRYNLTRFDSEETAAVRPELPAEDELVLELPAEEELTAADFADEEMAAPIDGLEEAGDAEASAEEEAAGEADASALTADAETEGAEGEETPAAETAEDDTEPEVLYTWVDVESDPEDEDDIRLETVVTPAELEDEEEEDAASSDGDARFGENGEAAEAALPDGAGTAALDLGDSAEKAPEADGASEGDAAAAAGTAADSASAGTDAVETAEESTSADSESPMPTAAETAAAPADADAAVRTASGVRLDLTDYTEEQLELIWAVVAQEDDTSYDGALAVISSVMNRADVNYGGFGDTAFDQLTAESQYACSADVEDPLYYERRLGGNVPDFVKQAVNDCLKTGIRNNSYTSFRSADYIDGSVQIGANYYFFETAGNAAEAIRNMSDVIGDVAEEVDTSGEFVPEDGIYDEAELPDAYYMPSETTEEAFDEEAEVLLVEAPEETGEDEASYYGGIDGDGYVVIDAVPDFER